MPVQFHDLNNAARWIRRNRAMLCGPLAILLGGIAGFVNRPDAASGSANNASPSGRSSQTTQFENPQPTSAAGPFAATEQSGPLMMRQVVRACQMHRTISASLRHEVHLFGQKLYGKGRFRQQRTNRGLQVRFELEAAAFQRKIELLQVCDGRYYWMKDNLGGRLQLRRADLARLRRDAKLLEVTPPPKLLGGGLVTLLASLEENFVIAQPQAVTFQEIPMWALTMRWKPTRLDRLFPVDRGAPDTGKSNTGKSNTGKSNELAGQAARALPAQVPDRIVLLVGQDDLFPYRIDFRKTTGDGGLMARLELFAVQFDAELDPLEFQYKPPADIRPENLTETYLLELQTKAAKLRRSTKAS